MPAACPFVVHEVARLAGQWVQIAARLVVIIIVPADIGAGFVPAGLAVVAPAERAVGGLVAEAIGRSILRAAVECAVRRSGVDPAQVVVAAAAVAPR